MRQRILGVLVLIFALGQTSPAQSEKKMNVLVFVGMDQWHGTVIPDAIRAFENLADRHHFEMKWTQEHDFFTSGRYDGFNVLVFLNGLVNGFAGPDKTAFEDYMEDGGAFVGIHYCSSKGEWPWFEALVGRTFIEHPVLQTGVVHVADPDHVSTMHLPSRFLWTDEFYIFSAPHTEDQHILLKAETATISGVDEPAFLPLAWTQEYGGGRSFYTALGHTPGIYADEDFMEHIYGGICWAAGILEKE